eukprot:TRINITY_DN32441_c0_g1_i1.p1 TRINITY_DN32441_c0_g1~~TRINITY_DN32441_c0_g1_i1.p1  ORF type:complete len:196 (+),score=52.42 TRINITY_DN32441_c0_g1_i1:70-657(+)
MISDSALAGAFDAEKDTSKMVADAEEALTRQPSSRGRHGTCDTDDLDDYVENNGQSRSVSPEPLVQVQESMKYRGHDHASLKKPGSRQQHRLHQNGGERSCSPVNSPVLSSSSPPRHASKGLLNTGDDEEEPSVLLDTGGERSCSPSPMTSPALRCSKRSPSPMEDNGGMRSCSPLPETTSPTGRSLPDKALLDP